MDAVIIRAGNVETTYITQACNDAGIDETVTIGSSFGYPLIEAAAPAIVIGVLKPAAFESIDDSDADSKKSLAFTNLDVLLRVGMALERGAFVCLITPPPLRPPEKISTLTIIPSPVDDIESLRLHIWAFVTNIPRDDQQPEAQAASQNHIEPNHFLQSLEIISQEENPGRRALQTEYLTGELLRAAGVSFAENPETSRPDDGFDLAVLPDPFSSDITYIQVKAGRLDERRLHHEELRLQQAVLKRHCQLGVLIYHYTSWRKIPGKRTTPLVIRIALEDLIRRLGRKDFHHVLSEEIAETVERI